MKVTEICFVFAVFCVQMSSVLANPFFNFAVKTKSGEEGHKVSLVYPKDSYDFSFNVKSTKINSNSFDFAGLISSFTKGFAGFFSGFSSLSNLSSFSNPLKPATSTIDPLDDFGKDFDGGNSFNADDIDSNSSSTTEESSVLSPDSDDTNSDFSTDSDSSSNSNDFDIRTGGSDNGYEYPKKTTGSVAQATVKVSYLPPVTSMRPPHLPTKKPASIYLPSS